MLNLLRRIRPMGAVVAVSALLSGALLSGCGGGGGNASPASPSGSFSSPEGVVQFSLSADKSTYAAGETATLTCTEAEEVDINSYRDVDQIIRSPFPMDLAVARNGQTVWQASRVGSTIPSGKIYTYVERGLPTITEFKWDLKDQQGNALPAGKYTVRAWVNAVSIGGVDITNPETQASAKPITITLQ